MPCKSLSVIRQYKLLQNLELCLLLETQKTSTIKCEIQGKIREISRKKECYRENLVTRIFEFQGQRDLNRLRKYSMKFQRFYWFVNYSYTLTYLLNSYVIEMDM